MERFQTNSTFFTSSKSENENQDIKSRKFSVDQIADKTVLSYRSGEEDNNISQTKGI